MKKKTKTKVQQIKYKMSEKITKEEIAEKLLTPAEILGATNTSGEIEFLIRWNEEYEPKLVKSCDAKIICPMLVIAFYEKRLMWQHEITGMIKRKLEEESDSDGSTTVEEIR